MVEIQLVRSGKGSFNDVISSGNIPIGTFQTFDGFQIEDIGEDGSQDILLVGLYGVEEELCRDIRVYTEDTNGYILNRELTQELEKEE